MALMAIDLSVDQNGGLIPGYNYRRYGASLAELVRASEVGVASGPAITPSAYHLLKVESRETTEIESVRDDLMQKLMDAVPSWEELASLESEVRASASVPSGVGGTGHAELETNARAREAERQQEQLTGAHTRATEQHRRSRHGQQRAEDPRA